MDDDDDDDDDSDDDVIVIDSVADGVRSIKKKHRKVVSASSNWMSDSMFDCKETDVAKRLTTILAESEKNNAKVSTQDGDGDDDASKMPSRFGSNIHRPEFENVPSVVQVHETAPPGTLLVKVRPFRSLKCLFCFSKMVCPNG